MQKYNHKNLEKKWKEKWKETNLYKTEDNYDKEKFYILDMFPYPSGAGLHVGHPKGYIATDIFARMKMMQGFNVLHPIGWDAFGLPAENFAIKNKIHPRIATEKNVDTFKKQLEKLGLTYDWSREINTTDPSFYKWTQWIFLQLFKKGLAYESNEPVNWCPSCKTVLSNEDLEGDFCERCDTLVEKKPMRQWVLKITDYAERMLNDLEKLPDWEHSIKEMQKNWIGKSLGAKVVFKVKSETKEKTFNKIYLASGNESKIRRLKKLFEKAMPGIIVEQVPELIEVPETGKDGWENSRLKVEAYKNKYEYPVFAGDTAIMIEGEDFDPTHIKRAALNGVNENELSQEEIAEKMKEFYINIARRNGGKKEFYYEDFWTVLMPTGEIYQANNRRECILTDEIHHKLDIFFPMKSLYLCKKTGKNAHNLSEDEYWIEFASTVCAIKKLINKANSYEELEVFTTRPDTLFGCTYMAIAPEHNLITNYELQIRNYNEVKNYIDITKNKSDLERTDLAKEKTGVKINGLVAINPLNNEEIPIFVADYVLAGYGTGAVMAVPAHDERDFEFAKKYNLPIKKVVFDEKEEELFIGDGIAINSDFLDGLETKEAKKKIVKWLEKNNVGEEAVNYKIKDWVFARQRYWGEPIPLIHCDKCGVVAVPEKDLPVLLPEVESYEPTGTGESPLANISEWVNTKCPKCGGDAKRETDTMPQWAGSSWYYLRYIDPHNDECLVDKKKEKYWSPVDFYVGGAEHATRHLIYARFWHKFLYDIGVVSCDEPFKRLQYVGLIMAEDGRKMSKRWGNVINPDEIVESFGADAMRVYEMFMGPFSQTCAWNTNGLVGARKFLDKAWNLRERVFKQEIDKYELKSLLHKTIKKVGEDIEDFKFNTAVSAMMILLNNFEKQEKIEQNDFELFLKALAPFAPHLCEELWESFGYKESIFKQEWPLFSDEFVQNKFVDLVVQVNGKLRENINFSVDVLEDEIKEIVLKNEKIKKWIDGKEIVKIIFVKGKLLNIVVK